MLGVAVGLVVLSGACGADTIPEPGGDSLAQPGPGGPPAPSSSTAPPPSPATGDASDVGVEAGTDAGAPPVDGGDDASPPPPPPPWADGIKNGTETDVDCGGGDIVTPRCKPTKTCASAADCTTAHCAAGACALLAPSCTGAAGTSSCGLAGDESCCASLPVPGGSYNRFSDPAYPGTVATFRLDRYQITVGRLRAFLEAKGGNPKGAPPAPGAGAHPKVANSGWRASFNTRLPASWLEINDRLGAAGCAKGGDNTDGGAATWTAAPGPYESLPITCIDWYTLFAFCAWDGGRLPTDLEWGYAAMGGSEERLYAWSQPDDPPMNLTWGVHDSIVAASLWDPVNQVYKFSVGTPFRTTDPATGKVIDGPAHISPPGRKTGYGKWGHADLTGNVLEFLLDTTPIAPGPCNDCAAVDWNDPPQDQPGAYPMQWITPGTNESPDGNRSLRGGSWDPTHAPYAYYYYSYAVPRTYYAAGGRCARD
jgi:formylglycine-generating enzyme